MTVMLQVTSLLLGVGDVSKDRDGEQHTRCVSRRALLVDDD